MKWDNKKTMQFVIYKVQYWKLISGGIDGLKKWKRMMYVEFEEKNNLHFNGASVLGHFF